MKSPAPRPSREAGFHRLAYIIGTYPSLTTTFIDREVAALRERGVDPVIVSIRRPRGRLSSEQERLRASITYLLPVSLWVFIGSHLQFAVLSVRRYFGTVLYLLTRPHPDARSRLKTLFHFLEGVAVARILENHYCGHVHAHFVDRAATVALVAARLLGISYSVTAHANDIYVKPLLLKEKLMAATFAATCTAYNKNHLDALIGSSANGKVVCIYHGLDLGGLEPRASATNARPILLAVGQLKEKKGFAYLLRACGTLRAHGYDFECQIVGEGPLRPALETQVRELRLQETVTFCGALPHDEVVEKYARATLFVLPCVVAEDGDRDGIPNVILEAMAMRLPVVSTRHSGIPEVIEDHVNGLLVPPADDQALADALCELLEDSGRRRAIGERARYTVLERFDARRNVETLLAYLTHSVGIPAGWAGPRAGARKLL